MIELQNIIKYNFKDERILRQALTHSSFANEQRINKKQHNERIEFLGDAVLELVISEYLFVNNPNKNEGTMTKMRSSLVCEFTLSQCANDIELGRFLFLSKGEEQTGGRTRSSILCDAFESVIGAIYLDGGFEEAKKFINRYLLQDVEDKTLFYDAKTILQEIVQSKGREVLAYELVEERGPDHNKEFVVHTLIGDKIISQGTGSTKKAAEQMAAYKTILLLKKKDK